MWKFTWPLHTKASETYWSSFDMRFVRHSLMRFVSVYVQVLQVLLDDLGISDAVAVIQQLLCTFLKAVQHKVLLLVAILVTHFGLWREWVKLPQFCFACEKQQGNVYDRHTTAEHVHNCMNTDAC